MTRLDEKRSVIAVESGHIDLSALHQNNDYRCAQVGFDLLLKRGFQFTQHLPSADVYRHVLSASLWSSPQGRRSPEEVAQDLVALFLSLRGRCSADLWYITQGSPRFADSVSSILLEQGASILDTESSAELAYAATGSTLPVHFPRKEDPAREGHANVFTAFGSCYPPRYRLDVQLKRARRAFLVSLGYESVAVQIDPNTLDLGDVGLHSKTLILEI
jgi:hypothetical protein